MILCEHCQKQPVQLQGGCLSPENGQWVSCKLCDDLNKGAPDARLEAGAQEARLRLEITGDFAEALLILRDLYAVRNLDDITYDVREREGLGWEGPQVVKWSNACERAAKLLDKYSPDAKV